MSFEPTNVSFFLAPGHHPKKLAIRNHETGGRLFAGEKADPRSRFRWVDALGLDDRGLRKPCLFAPGRKGHQLPPSTEETKKGKSASTHFR
jgi:hypothetical protein